MSKRPPDAFPEELRERAGSLLPAQVSRCDLAAGIANRLLTYADSLPSAGIWSPTGSGWPCWASRYSISSVSGG